VVAAKSGITQPLGGAGGGHADKGESRRGVVAIDGSSLQATLVIDEERGVGLKQGGRWGRGLPRGGMEEAQRWFGPWFRLVQAKLLVPGEAVAAPEISYANGGFRWAHIQNFLFQTM
jgi:hypothetical protein